MTSDRSITWNEVSAILYRGLSKNQPQQISRVLGNLFGTTGRPVHGDARYTLDVMFKATYRAGIAPHLFAEIQSAAR